MSSSGKDKKLPDDTATVEISIGTTKQRSATKKFPEIPCVVLLVGPVGDVGKKWSVDKDGMTIGRSTKVDIDISDKSVSKFHARFTLYDGMVSITDLGATNGTFLNSKPLTSYKAYPLRSNDQITIGKIVLKFLEK